MTQVSKPQWDKNMGPFGSVSMIVIDHQPMKKFLHHCHPMQCNATQWSNYAGCPLLLHHSANRASLEWPSCTLKICFTPQCGDTWLQLTLKHSAKPASLEWPSCTPKYFTHCHIANVGNTSALLYQITLGSPLDPFIKVRLFYLFKFANDVLSRS